MTEKMVPGDKVYNYVYEKIMSGEWEQGSKIASENDLCSQLNVSRVSVRQAFEKLVALGLLVKKRGSGTYINKIEAKTYLNSLMPIILLEDKDLISVLEFRKYFEYGNVCMFIDHYSDKRFKELEEQFEIMQKHKDEPAEFYTADFTFHSIIADGTQNPVVIKINEILLAMIFKHHEILHTEIGSSVGLEYHARILEAINKRDKELAGLIMMRHIEAAISELKKVMF